MTKAEQIVFHFILTTEYYYNVSTRVRLEIYWWVKNKMLLENIMFDRSGTYYKIETYH